MGFASEKGLEAEAIVAKNIDLDGNWKSPRPLFDRLIRSQATHHPPDSPRSKIRRFKPQFPKTIWDTPVAMKRRKNIVRAFWADLLDKIQPPLPEAEWNRLRDLTTGVIPFKEPPPRRAPAIQERYDSHHSLLSSAYLTTPVRAAARPERDTREHKIRKQHITARFMRRIFATVWSHSPLASYNGETGEWTVVWGGGKSAASRGLAGSPGSSDLELFEEKDERSKVPKVVRRVFDESESESIGELQVRTNEEESRTPYFTTEKVKTKS
jgi:hypothetical protein